MSSLRHPDEIMAALALIAPDDAGFTELMGIVHEVALDALDSTLLACSSYVDDPAHRESIRQEVLDYLSNHYDGG